MTTKFSCKNCSVTICKDTDFFCFFPPTSLNLNGGALFTNAVPNSLQFEPVYDGKALATCQQCLTLVGFKIVNAEEFPPYVRDDMLYFNIDRLIASIDGFETSNDFLSPNAFFCKSCVALIAGESSIQNHAMMQNNSVKRVVLSSLENCIVDENAPPRPEIGNFRAAVCCARCKTHLGWQRFLSDDVTWIGNGVGHLQLDKLWFRYCNIIVPAERMIAPTL